MSREAYEDAVATAMWTNEGIRRVLAFETVQKRGDVIFMAFSKGRSFAAVAKALATELKGV